YLTCIVMVPMLVLTGVGCQLAKVTARYAICTLPAVTLLCGLLIQEVICRVGQLPELGRARNWLLAALLPALLVGDYLQADVAYYGEQHGQRGSWRQAAQFVRDQAAARGYEGIRVLSVNHPTMLYYLRPRHWFVGDTDPYPTIDVSAVVPWRFTRGVDHTENILHPPGIAAHLEWHQRIAARESALFAVVFTLPELREHDPRGEFEAIL